MNNGGVLKELCNHKNGTNAYIIGGVISQHAVKVILKSRISQPGPKLFDT